MSITRSKWFTRSTAFAPAILLLALSSCATTTPPPVQPIQPVTPAECLRANWDRLPSHLSRLPSDFPCQPGESPTSCWPREATELLSAKATDAERYQQALALGLRCSPEH